MTLLDIETVGWLGGVLFAVSAVPQAWKVWRDKHADDLTWGFLWTWLLGEILMIWFILSTSRQPQLIFNYTVNLLCLLVILRYKVWPANFLYVTEVNHEEKTVTLSSTWPYQPGDKLMVRGNDEWH